MMRASEAIVLGFVVGLPALASALGSACSPPKVDSGVGHGGQISQTAAQGGASGSGGVGGFTAGGVTVILPDAGSPGGAGGDGTGGSAPPAEVWPPGPDFKTPVKVSYGEYSLGPLLSSLGGATGQGGAGGSGGSSGHCAGLFAVVRDFKMWTSATSGGHPDFEKPPMVDDRGIVTDTLGDDGKPIYAGSTRTTSDQTNFDQWYRDVDGVNMSYILGLKFVSTGGNVITFAASIGNSGAPDSSYFPLDDAGLGNEKKQHNYAFTTEIHTAFLYNGGEIFTFQGDDDVFVFINKHLAIDLGGIHSQETQTVDLDAQAAALEISTGNIYDLAVFNAERHTTQSNFRIDTTMTFTNCGVVNGVIY
jgi:fibro-slime domain-containing protein